MTKIRSFIAIELTDDLLEGLSGVQDELRANEWADDVRWVRPTGIHLTLKFLGDVPASRIDAIGEGVTQAVTGIRPFTVTAEGLGVFPNWRRTRVIWIGVNGDTDQLHALQENVEAAMQDLGFEPENRPFHPHFTLGRVNRRAGSGYRRRLGEALQAYEVGTVGEMFVDRVSLMRSQLTPEGAIYSELSNHPLET